MGENKTKCIVERLRQDEIIRESSTNGDNPWTVLSDSWKTEDGNSVGRYVVLAHPSERKTILERSAWNLSKGDGLPGFVEQSSSDNDESIEYVRYSQCPEGLEPLLIQQDFGNVVPSVMHVSEEFRLLMNLWRDVRTCNYFEIKKDGSKDIAIRFDGNKIEVRTSLLKRYQAARQLDVVLFTDAHVDISCDKTKEDFSELRTKEKKELYSYLRELGDGIKSKGVSSRVLVKRILPPPSRNKCGIWPWDEVFDYPEFIIKEDSNGQQIKYTCNPEKLTNDFIKVSTVPSYLTPVFFKAEVLQRYYDDPKLYNVADGYLSCGNMWTVHIDNESSDVVSVFLGDIGRHIPSRHRPHWLAYNIPPTRTMSDIAFRRSFLAQIIESKNPEHCFKSAYRNLQEAWHKNWGWHLYRKRTEREGENLNRVRIPLKDTNIEFEQQILSLAILLVDLLNEEDIGADLQPIKNEKGIDKLRRFLEKHKYPNTDRNISLLKKIQKTRSKGAAHASGESGQGYIDKQIGNTTKKDYISQIMIEATNMLNDLASFIPNSSV
jgi:hypothetical protein